MRTDQSIPALRTFIETAPLYAVKTIPELAHYSKLLFPRKVEVHCRHCKKMRPFVSLRPWLDETDPTDRKTIESWVAFSPSDPSVAHEDFVFGCVDCGDTFYVCLEIDLNQGRVRKVGQRPMWLPEIDDSVREGLGEQVEFYRKALMNMSQGYGIGACAYLRRLVENYINPLLELLKNVKEQEKASHAELDKIQEAIVSKDFSKKTKFAAGIAPASIIVDGMNPLKTIHDILSDGLHNLDEERAMEAAQQLRSSIVFVITELRGEYERKKRYVDSMKSLKTRK